MKKFYIKENWLKKLTELTGITLKELAHYINVDYRYLRNLNSNKFLTLQVLEKIANLYNIETNILQQMIENNIFNSILLEKINLCNFKNNYKRANFLLIATKSFNEKELSKLYSQIDLINKEKLNNLK